MGIMAGVALPRLQNTARTQRLEEGTNSFSEFIRQARLEAVKRRLKVRLKIVEDGAGYSFGLQDRESRNQENFSTFGDSFLDGIHYFPDRVRWVREPGSSVETDPVYMFSPSGYGEPQKVFLMDTRGRQAIVELGKLYDQITVRFDNVEGVHADVIQPIQ